MYRFLWIMKLHDFIWIRDLFLSENLISRVSAHIKRRRYQFFFRFVVNTYTFPSLSLYVILSFFFVFTKNTRVSYVEFSYVILVKFLSKDVKIHRESVWCVQGFWRDPFFSFATCMEADKPTHMGNRQQFAISTENTERKTNSPDISEWNTRVRWWETTRWYMIAHFIF